MNNTASMAEPRVSVLAAGWDYDDNPVAKAMASYGCDVVTLPNNDRKPIPACDITILAVSFVGHPFSNRVKEACRVGSREIVFMNGSFGSCRDAFEAALNNVRERKRKQRKIIVAATPGSEVVMRRAIEAEEKIEQRARPAELVPMPVIPPAPTIESVIRKGYADKLSPELIAAELNRLGFKNRRGTPFQPNSVSWLASNTYFCARKGKGKAGTVPAAPAVDPNTLIADIMRSSLTAESKVAYANRILSGELTSLIDSGVKSDDRQVLAWRTPVLEPSRGVQLKLSKAEACLVVEHFEVIREFAESE
jgi:hypothetical protein